MALKNKQSSKSAGKTKANSAGKASSSAETLPDGDVAMDDY